MSQRVVVTGAGAVSALGDDWITIKEKLVTGQSAVRYMPEWEQYSELNTKLAAPVDHFTLPDDYPKRKTRSMGRVAQFGVVATERALKSANLLNDPILKSGKAGVAYGSATGSSAGAMELFDMLDSGSMKKLKTTSYLRMMSHTAAINISVFFGTQGRMLTTSSACTAGSQGIGAAYEAIKYGHQTVMLAGGAEELCPTQAGVFDVMYATSQKNEAPQQSVAAFDQNRDGLVLGEGACTLVLESLDHAQARGAAILAEVIGYATNTDGNHLIRPNQHTVEQVMIDCIDSAQIKPEQVAYISGHGTGTEHGDINESNAVEAVFGNKTPFSAIKGYTGHTLGACGAFEAWIAMMMMQEGWFVPNLNLTQRDSNCADLDYIVEQPRELQANIIMSNNFAFGGVNTALLFQRFNG